MTAKHMMKKKWIPLVGGLAAVVAVVVPFLLVNRQNDAHAGLPNSRASTADTPTAGAPPLTQVENADENQTAEQKEMAMLEQHLSNAPAHTPVLLRLAELARQSGKNHDAVKYLRQAVKAEPSNQDARLELGRALFEAGDIVAAIEETKKLIELYPKNTDALYNLGAIYGNLGNTLEARKHFRLAVAANPSSESGVRSKKALEQLQVSVAVAENPGASPSARIRILP